MQAVSVVIPTFNRFEELIITLPQIAKYIDQDCELIVFDQSNTYNPEDHTEIIEKLLGSINFRYYHCDTPSVTLAWNTAASLAKGDIILFLDDDIDVDFDVISAHRNKYLKNPKAAGVAGSYYASSYERKWVPSSKGGRATALAGVNASFLKVVFERSGVASNYIKPFAGFDWEIAEHVNSTFGDLLVGDDIVVFHRAPALGGCGNQSKRQQEWYYGAYHNHVLWLLTRPFPSNILRIPRHIYWIIRYCLPSRDTLFTKSFLNISVINAILDACSSYRKAGGKRESRKLSAKNYKPIAGFGQINKLTSAQQRHTQIDLGEPK